MEISDTSPRYGSPLEGEWTVAGSDESRGTVSTLWSFRHTGMAVTPSGVTAFSGILTETIPGADPEDFSYLFVPALDILRLVIPGRYEDEYMIVPADGNGYYLYPEGELPPFLLIRC